jgi:hypothetical protein
MKFFTRELYDEMQESEDDLLWDEMLSKYGKHLDSIKPTLPKSMREFLKYSMHDGKVTSAKCESGDVVVLEMEGIGFWGPRLREHGDLIESSMDAFRNSGAFAVALPQIGKSRVTLIFRGVFLVEGIMEIVGDDWVDEEVHLSSSAGFDLQVLLEQTELRIVANDIELIDHDCGKNELC